MRANVELLVEVEAASVQEAEAIGDRIAEDMKLRYQLPIYGMESVGYGQVIDVSVEAAAEKQERPEPLDA